MSRVSFATKAEPVGAHVHVRVFAGPEVGQRALVGTLIMAPDESSALENALHAPVVVESILESILDEIEKPLLSKPLGAPGSLMRRAQDHGLRLAAADRTLNAIATLVGRFHQPEGRAGGRANDQEIVDRIMELVANETILEMLRRPCDECLEIQKRTPGKTLVDGMLEIDRGVVLGLLTSSTTGAREVNREGLTLAEWVAAAAAEFDSLGAVLTGWNAGEDPTEWRAARCR